MEKLLNFLSSPKGIRLAKGLNIFSLLTFAIAVILYLPAFWIESYESSWMYNLANYLMIPFGIYAFLFFFLFIPFLWYMTNTEKFKESSLQDKGYYFFMKGLALFSALIPGALLYNLLSNIPELESVFIFPVGIINIIPMFIFGFLYLTILSLLFKRPFRKIMKYFPEI